MYDCEHRTQNSGNVKTFSKSRPIKKVPGKLSNFKFQDIQSNLHTLTCKIIVQHILFTPSITEIIWVSNVRAIVVCGFLIKSLIKNILKF